MANKKNTIRVSIAVLLSTLLLLTLIPSLVGATPIQNEILFERDDGTIKASVGVSAEALSNGQWMYSYSLTNLSPEAALHSMYIGWMVDDSNTPLASAVEIGLLGDAGEKVATYFVPPTAPYSMGNYDGVTFWDWGLTYSSKFRFSLDVSETLDVYVVYDNYVTDQYITLSGSGSVTGENNLPDNNPVPEPGTLLLLGTGLFSLGVFGRKKFKAL